MSNTKLRTFVINGIEMKFNLNIFNDMFTDKVRKTKMKVGELEQDIADDIFVEKSTVHTWRNKNSGPSDVEKIKAIAEYFECDYMDLMLEVEEYDMEDNNKMNNRCVNVNISDKEREAVNLVYMEMLEHLRIAELVVKPQFVLGETMGRYDSSGDVARYDVSLEAKFDDIYRRMQDVMLFLSKTSYNYLLDMAKVLLDIESILSELNEDNEKEIAKLVKIETSRFFDIASLFMYK